MAFAASSTPIEAQSGVVTVSGTVLDQHGKPPLTPESVGAVRFMTLPTDTEPGHEVATGVVGKDGHYSAQVPAGQYAVSVLLDDEHWELPERITVDVSGPGPVPLDIRVVAQDITLQGQIGGADLDATGLQRVDVLLWTYSHSAGLDYKRDGAHYSLKVGPGTWRGAQAEYHASKGPEGRIDALYPFNVDPARSTANWTLPTFSFTDAGCVPPGTCRVVVSGTGWVPGEPVGIYVVAFDRHDLLDLGRGPVLRSPSDVDRSQGDLVATVSADDDGQIAGAVDGTTASPFPRPILLGDTVYSFEAVQQVGPSFKVAQPAGSLDLPPFHPVISIEPDGRARLTVVAGAADDSTPAGSISPDGSDAP